MTVLSKFSGCQTCKKNTEPKEMRHKILEPCHQPIMTGSINYASSQLARLNGRDILLWIIMHGRLMPLSVQTIEIINMLVYYLLPKQGCKASTYILYFNVRWKPVCQWRTNLCIEVHYDTALWSESDLVWPAVNAPQTDEFMSISC